MRWRGGAGIFRFPPKLTVSHFQMEDLKIFFLKLEDFWIKDEVGEWRFLQLYERFRISRLFLVHSFPMSGDLKGGQQLSDDAYVQKLLEQQQQELSALGPFLEPHLRVAEAADEARSQTLLLKSGGQ